MIETNTMKKLFSETLRQRKDYLLTLQKNSTTKDEGAMFLIVIVIMLTMFVLLTAVLMWTMTSIQTTSLQTSSYKTVNAAESGRDNALSNIANNNCIASTGNSLDSSSRYEISVYRFSDSTGFDAPEDITDPGVYPGCPTDSTTHVLIESTGYSDSAAGGGERSRTIVATYGYEANTGFGEGQAINNSLTVSDDTTLGFDVLADTGQADPLAVNGSFACETDSAVEVNGNVHVFDSSSTSNFEDCEIIVGDFITAGNIETSPLDPTNNVVVQGDVCAEGTAPANLSEIVNGNVQYGQGPGSCSEHLDASEAWTDYSPSLVGVNVINAASEGMCENTVNVNPKGEVGLRLETYTGENVLDFTDCTEDMIMGSDDENAPIELNINSDVTLLFGEDAGYSFSNVEVNSDTGFGYDFNIITADNTADMNNPEPHCETDADNALNNFTMNNAISGLVYTPCDLEFSGENHITGQMVAGGLSGDSEESSLNYIPLLLPDNEHSDSMPSDDAGFITNYTPLSYIER